ncbi:MAG: 5-formyltetrahydrofolate cyclo-ligase [Thermoprotei archaeon]|nr:MAG: 5-formyltetrahydrofolate cyclo-ligase [Thermoprotei archaeon]
MSQNVKAIKANIREKIWRILEERKVSLPPKPIIGRIPNFIGANLAASKVARLKVFEKANVIKVDPDSPLKSFREIALRHGKILVMPTPKLRRGFLVLNPRHIPSNRIAFASTIRGAFNYGKIINNPYKLPRIDLFVVGCVAVSIVNGIRLGKGGGFSDLEYAILLEADKIDREIFTIALVHDYQVLRQLIPYEIHDAPVDFIVTPTRFLNVENRVKRPKGLYCELLSNEHRALDIVKNLGKCN